MSSDLDCDLFVTILPVGRLQQILTFHGHYDLGTDHDSLVTIFSCQLSAAGLTSGRTTARSTRTGAASRPACAGFRCTPATLKTGW